jgi:translation initiation factor 1A
MPPFHKQGHGAPEGEFNPDAPVRVKMPRGREVIGIIAQRVGAGRMQISCMDGKTRNCRVPGRLRRELWLREGDVVIVEPWEFDQDEKGDILFKYSKAAIEKLKEMGQLKTSDSEF